MRLVTAFLLLTSTHAQRRLFDSTKMTSIINAEESAMTVNGTPLERKEQIEAEVDAIVALYEEAIEVNDDFNFEIGDKLNEDAVEEYDLGEIRFYAEEEMESPTMSPTYSGKSVKMGKSGKRSKTEMLG